jgi:hypothetical protein
LQPDQDGETLYAAMRSYQAAAACSAMTARLLLAEGIDLQAHLKATAGVEGHSGPLSSGPASAWRANVLAAAAAIAELETARSAWQLVERLPNRQVVAMIETLLSYAMELTDVLDADKPAPVNGTSVD